MPNAVDHVEAALARLTREDIAALPPARRRRLQASLGAWECLCRDLAQPQGQQQPHGGVLSLLARGDRTP